jgi:spermidine/putrescine-binding protein
MTDVATAANKTLQSDGSATRLLAGSHPPSIKRIWAVVLLVFALAFLGIQLLGGPPPQVNLLVRMMTEQEDWLRTNVLTPFAQENDFEISIRRYNSVQDVERALGEDPSISLVKVELAMLRPLVDAELLMPIDTYLKDHDRQDELDHLLASFRPLAIEMAMVPDDVTLHLYGIPRKLETSVLLYRESKVADAVARWPEHLPELEEQLISKTGHGLPNGYALEADPSKWDLYDVFVAGWYWRRSEPRMMNRSFDYIHTFFSLYEQLSGLSNEPTPKLAATPAMIDLFEWEALFRELGLYREQMFVRGEPITGRVVQDAMAKGDIYLTRMHSLGIKLVFDAATPEVKSDLRAALAPLGVSLQLDSEGAPARIGSRRSAVTGWFWAIPKRAPHPEQAYRLARHLSSNEVAAREMEAFFIQPALKDMKPVHGPFADLILPVADVQLKIAADNRVPAVPTKKDVDQMSSQLIGAWWKIVAERRYLDDGRIDRRTLTRALESAL